jgi:chaperonin GroEL (HSP60 family)
VDQCLVSYCVASTDWTTLLQGLISNILEENVLQPLLVSTSAIELATETVALILRIDDIQVSSGLADMASVDC